MQYWKEFLLLKDQGPDLPSPYADVLHGSKNYKNFIVEAVQILEQHEKSLEEKNKRHN